MALSFCLYFCSVIWIWICVCIYRLTNSHCCCPIVVVLFEIEIKWFWFYGCCYIIYESHDNALPSGINIKENEKPVTGTLFSIFFVHFSSEISLRGMFRLQWKMTNIFMDFPLLLFGVFLVFPIPNSKPRIWSRFQNVLLIILKSLAVTFQLWSKFISFTIYHSFIWFDCMDYCLTLLLFFFCCCQSHQRWGYIDIDFSTFDQFNVFICFIKWIHRLCHISFINRLIHMNDKYG